MLHGYTPPHRYLPYLSWTQIAELPDRANTVIVLPTGAIEQHGPHLPCSVDSVIASGVIGHALARLPDSVPAFALPPITYGKSEEHLHFPGTMTLTGTTLLSTVIEIGESVYRSGFRKMVIANGHGGQPQVMEMAARELRLRYGDFVIIPTSVWKMPSGTGAFTSDREKRLAMHAMALRATTEQLRATADRMFGDGPQAGTPVDRKEPRSLVDQLNALCDQLEAIREEAQAHASRLASL